MSRPSSATSLSGVPSRFRGPTRTVEATPSVSPLAAAAGSTNLTRSWLRSRPNSWRRSATPNAVTWFGCSPVSNHRLHHHRAGRGVRTHARARAARGRCSLLQVRAGRLDADGTTCFVLADLDSVERAAALELGFEPLDADLTRAFPCEAPHLRDAYDGFRRCAGAMLRQTARMERVPWEAALAVFLEAVAQRDVRWWLAGSGPGGSGPGRHAAGPRRDHRRRWSPGIGRAPRAAPGRTRGPQRRLGRRVVGPRVSGRPPGVGWGCQAHDG